MRNFIGMTAIIPLSLYIHIPWCIRKCPYCDFNSHKKDQGYQESRYIEALIADLDAQRDLLKARGLHSIFIGGGTPSLFKPESYQQLLDHLDSFMPIDSDLEITLEANPGTIDYSKFLSYRNIGINRLSIGIQSFNAQHLERLGRIHDPVQAKKAIQVAQDAGFENYNIDLMHGLPQQTAVEAIADIQTALSFSPPHLSWYQLTIEPNTVFYSKKPILPAENILEEIEVKGTALLNGYQHYEVSAFCQQGYSCKHNMNYWQFGDYLGIGAGAHSKVSIEDQIWRFEKKRMPKDYMQNPLQNIKKRQVDINERPLEFMLMCSRLRQPIVKAQFEQRTFLSIEDIRPQIDQAIKLNLLEETDETLILTAIGMRYLNEFQALFLQHS